MNMDNYFRQQSVFDFLDLDPPPCFRALERHFAPKVPNGWHPGMVEGVAFAENLCRRLADSFLYAWEVEELTKEQHPERPALISSRLVGYFGSCKALMDAGAIALTHLHSLGSQTHGGKVLRDKEQDFAKEQFWQTLQAEQPSAYTRVKPFKKTIAEVVLWRDATLHRVSPLVMTAIARDPLTNAGTFLHYSLKLRAGNTSDRYLTINRGDPSAEATYFHDRWKQHLIGFAEAICLDIQLKT